jgi:hypothetical protein
VLVEPGTYIVKLMIDGKVYTQKVIVEGETAIGP